MSTERGLPVRSSMVSVLALRGAGTATQMLVARRVGAYLDGVWSYLAGHVEAGETGWQAALRELREETALEPQSFWASSFCEQIYLAATDTVEIVPAFVARLAGDAQVHLNGEHSTFRWVTLDEAAALLPFGSQRDLLAHVRREFVEREPSPFLRLVPR
ncbi:NUDIX hydrolase [Rhodanobacter lindaniclasticus]